jgi:TldD protein
MFDKLRKMLGKIDADYADIRHEVKKVTEIIFNGKELSQIGSNSTDGYVVRILNNGGLSTVAFTKESDADSAIGKALESARLISENIEKPVRMAESKPVKDNFTPKLIEDPRLVSIDEKLELLRNYNNIALGNEKIVTTILKYYDVTRERHFISSEGSEIREDLITTAITGEITGKDGDRLQNVRVRAGGSNGFSTVRNQEANLEKQTSITVDLLKAEPVKGGTYNCILNQGLTGVFTHEAFGHFSEADIIETLPVMREKMKIGEKLGSDVVNIIDNATLPDQLGFYKYDDEGVEVRPVQLMKNGVLTGRLHSRRTASEMDEPISGHCVAEDFRYAPIVRMGTIYMEPGPNSFDDLLAQLGDGIYVLDPVGGQTAGENFTFGAQYGFMIKGGKIKQMVRDINVSGNLFQTLQDTVAVGNDLKLGTVGGCGKGQTNIRSCHGGPHILVNNVVIGGA